MGQKKDTNSDRFEGWHGGVVLEPNPHYESTARDINERMAAEKAEDGADRRARYNAAIHAEYEG